METVLAAALLADVPEQARRLLPGLCSGRTMATVGAPYALDGDVADVVLALRGPQVWLAPGCRTGTRTSLDPARRLATPLPGGEPLTGAAPARALAWARLATAAQSLGVGLSLLARTVAYVGQRVQFGVPIGAFQAVKHRLADTKIALEFARPLVFGAALTMAPADVAAAKVAAGEAAYAAARTALQLHGAIGYTAEYDLSLWLTKARALRTAWGTPPSAEPSSSAGPAPPLRTAPVRVVTSRCPWPRLGQPLGNSPTRRSYSSRRTPSADPDRVEEARVVDDAPVRHRQFVEPAQEVELLAVRVAEPDELPEHRQPGRLAQIPFRGGPAGGPPSVWKTTKAGSVVPLSR